MARKTKLTVEQINNFLNLTWDQNVPTITAVKNFLIAERDRRVAAGAKGGRKVTVTDKKAANAEYMRRWRKKKKESNTESD